MDKRSENQEEIRRVVDEEKEIEIKDMPSATFLKLNFYFVLAFSHIDGKLRTCQSRHTT